MKIWQKYWTYFIIVVVIWHSFRDALQFLGINNVISTTFVEHKNTQNLLWNPWNTVVIEGVTGILALKILVQQKFGFAGWFTIFVAFSTALGFGYYWFLVK